MSECGFGVCAFGRQCVEGEGPLPSPILLLGEAPGVQELKEGRPFIGRSGHWLDAALVRAGLERNAIRITNSCGCVALEREDRRPLPAELDSCRPRLEAEIELCDPKVVVLMGNTASNTYFPGMRIGELYMKWRANPKYIIIPTYHPAHVLRGHPQVKPVIEEALRDAYRIANEP